MRIMARGEGDDDFNMFGNPPTHAATTQTLPIDPLGDIRVHNAMCSVFHPISSTDREMQLRYGVGYDIASRHVHPTHPPRNPLGFTIADRLTQPHLHLDPLQPTAVTGRPGVGFSTAYNSHKFTKNCNFSVISPECSAEPFTTEAGHFIFSATPVDEWVEEEEDRESSPQSQRSQEAWCMAVLSSTSQTSPQDYQDLTRKQSGGFPLGEILVKAHDDTHPGFLCTWR
jgi:hypothetical protein